MIIQCPNCGSKFELRRKPSKIFKCPKCSFSMPFNLLFEKNAESGSAGFQKISTSLTNPGMSSSSIPNPPVQSTDKTVVVKGSGEMKTQLVEKLQPVKRRAVLQVTYDGNNYGTIPLPDAKTFDVGRLSSDGVAKLKLTPDKSMSRQHAAIRSLLNTKGEKIFQITSLKSENPVFVNGIMVKRGKAFTLKNGDKLRLGETEVIFRII